MIRANTYDCYDMNEKRIADLIPYLRTDFDLYDLVVLRNLPQLKTGDDYRNGTFLTNLFNQLGRVWTTKDELQKELDYQLELFPGIILLEHNGLLGSGRLKWHSDLSHHPSRPYPCRALFADQIPTDGSATTNFLSCRDWAEALDVNGFLNHMREYVCFHGPAYETGWKGRWNRLVEVDPRKCHEWIAYDETFVKSIVRMHNRRTYDLGSAEIKELEEILFEARGQIDTYVHEWKPNDVLIWNNRGVLHGRTPMTPGQTRRMFRITFDLAF